MSFYARLFRLYFLFSCDKSDSSQNKQLFKRARAWRLLFGGCCQLEHWCLGSLCNLVQNAAQLLWFGETATRIPLTPIKKPRGFVLLALGQNGNI